jgi:nitrogen fixation/metabolism regulation signal transduction histidine kinase
MRIAPVALFAGATGALLSAGWYGGSAICALVAGMYIRRLFAFQARTVKDMRRFIDAIYFSEFNISFKSFVKKGLASELIGDMEDAIQRFSLRLKKMETEQHFHQALLNRIDSGIMVVERSGKVIWVNRAALDVLGKPQPRLLTDLESVSPDLPDTLGRLIPRETKIIRIERGKNSYHFAVTAIYFILEGRELKLISLKNIQSVLEENESDAWKKLIRILTHEIMNSLTPIISLSETFSEQNSETQAMIFYAMQTIHRRSKGLVDFVCNYRKLTLIPQPVITRFSAREWVADVSQLLEANGLAFSYHVRPADMFIEADRGLMEQVLINLIKNACEAAPPGGRQVRVEVHISRNEYQRPIVKVSDNGEGIQPEVMDKIFVPFFTTKPHGSGIGLSICRQIVNLHGGHLSVQSEPDKGSCFTIRL